MLINITDHLGNVRVVLNNGKNVVETNDYYPYGMLMNSGATSVQPFKYSGKELDRMHGLNWYDHGARMSDPALGHWHVVDPLCEKYYDVSPYALCGNDPVNFMDNEFSGVRDANNVSRINDPNYLKKVNTPKTDIAGNNYTRQIGYLASPNGMLQKYTPQTGKIQRVKNDGIPVDLPSDPNCGNERLNSITPEKKS